MFDAPPPLCTIFRADLPSPQLCVCQQMLLLTASSLVVAFSADPQESTDVMLGGGILRNPCYPPEWSCPWYNFAQCCYTEGETDGTCWFGAGLTNCEAPSVCNLGKFACTTGVKQAITTVAGTDIMVPKPVRATWCATVCAAATALGCTALGLTGPTLGWYCPIYIAAMASGCLSTCETVLDMKIELVDDFTSKFCGKVLGCE